MANAYFWESKWLINSGKLAVHANCCCYKDCTDFLYGGVEPAEFVLEILGVSDSPQCIGGYSCALFENTFVLTRTASCQWQVTLYDPGLSGICRTMWDDDLWAITLNISANLNGTGKFGAVIKFQYTGAEFINYYTDPQTEPFTQEPFTTYTNPTNQCDYLGAVLWLTAL